MEWKRLGIIAVAIVVIIAMGAYAVFSGIGPGPGGNGDANASSYPTASANNTYNDTGGSGSSGGAGSGTGSNGGANASTSGPPFAFSVDKITQCGQTCRNVTATVYNKQSTPADDVTVYSQIYAGNDTKSGNRVWSGKQPVGHLDAGGSFTGVQTVRLSFSQAYSVKQHGGWITIVTTVQSANQTVTFKTRRKVA